MPGDSGLSVLEMLIVLALLGLAAAVVAPRGAVMYERALAHSVFFDLQRQVSDLRLRAYHSETAVALSGADAPKLRAGWAWTSDRAIRIDEGGACTPADILLTKNGRPVMRLRLGRSACRLERLS